MKNIPFFYGIDATSEAAFTAADGGDLQDVLKSFTQGVVTGMLLHGVGKGISKMKFCFVAGTGVLMASGGVKAIEIIRAGDMVKSLNPYTGKTENKRVLQTFENKTNELVNVYTSDGDVIQATPGHKFYANNSWVSAEDLRAGDILVNVNGQKVIVEKTQHEILDNPVKVYNFEVAENHTYFVGNDTGIAVHNAGCNNVKKIIPGRIGRYKNIRVDAELGGSGYLNVHVHVDGDKFMYDTTNKLFQGAPNIVNQDKKTIEALKKVLKEAESRGWRFKI